MPLFFLSSILGILGILDRFGRAQLILRTPLVQRDHTLANPAVDLMHTEWMRIINRLDAERARNLHARQVDGAFGVWRFASLFFAVLENAESI